MLAQDYTVEISSTRTVYYVHPANGLTTWEVRECCLASSGSWPIQCCAISTTHHITGSTGYDSLYLYPVLPNIMKCVWITMPALSVHSERQPRLCLHSGIQIEAYILWVGWDVETMLSIDQCNDFWKYIEPTAGSAWMCSWPDRSNSELQKDALRTQLKKSTSGLQALICSILFDLTQNYCMYVRYKNERSLWQLELDPPRPSGNNFQLSYLCSNTVTSFFPSPLLVLVYSPPSPSWFRGRHGWPGHW